TSLLTLYVMARVWTKGFWRARADAPEGDLADKAPSALIDESTDIAFDERADVGRMPIGMVIPTAVMVAAGLVLTLWAGPIIGFTDRAAADIADRGIYMQAVLGGDGR
ncbi:Na+/H+ antiporter subunit D, partial [Streptomyces sp. SID10244]|nr:Na+/H+ antiporter subunit D [Streptomyces sp. SID10244]